MIDGFVDQTMPTFIAFKDKIVKDANNLKQTLMEDDSLFGSQEVKEDQSFIKKTYYISRKIQKFPKLNDDLFKKSPTSL